MINQLFYESNIIIINNTAKPLSLIANITFHFLLQYNCKILAFLPLNFSIFVFKLNLIESPIF